MAELETIVHHSHHDILAAIFGRKRYAVLHIIHTRILAGLVKTGGYGRTHLYVSHAVEGRKPVESVERDVGGKHVSYHGSHFHAVVLEHIGAVSFVKMDKGRYDNVAVGGIGSETISALQLSDVCRRCAVFYGLYKITSIWGQFTLSPYINRHCSNHCRY